MLDIWEVPVSILGSEVCRLDSGNFEVFFQTLQARSGYYTKISRNLFILKPYLFIMKLFFCRSFFETEDSHDDA
jgi:hypothetical protein